MILSTYVIHQLYTEHCTNLLCSVLDQTVEGGSSLTPKVPAHLSIPLITVRGIGTGTGLLQEFGPSTLAVPEQLSNGGGRKSGSLTG